MMMNKACGEELSRLGFGCKFTELLSKKPSWAEMCRQREEAARKLKESQA